MDAAQARAELTEQWRGWLLPGISLLIFTGVFFVLHRQLAQFRLSSILMHLRAIPSPAIAGAVLLTAMSYWLLGFYDVLALRYLGRQVPYARTAFTSFIAYSFGHNFGIAAFTGAAVRYRLYSSVGLSAADVATIAAFCALTTAIGLGLLAGVSFVTSPIEAAQALHLHYNLVFGLGVLLILLVALYALWSLLGPQRAE